MNAINQPAFHAAPVADAATLPGSLASRAMLSNVVIRQWSARRMDKRATDAVIQNANAADDAGRFNKLLIPALVIKPVESAATACRSFHYSRTLPWLDDGARILPALAFDAYSAGMRRLRMETDIWWDEQKTVTRDGKVVFVDESGGEWTFDQLTKVVEDEEDSDNG